MKQLFCGLTQLYAVQCKGYLQFICLHFAIGYPTLNAIFSAICRWNGLVLVFKWKLRTWGIQKCPYMSQYQLPNQTYKPLNVIGRIYLIAAVLSSFILVIIIWHYIWFNYDMNNLQITVTCKMWDIVHFNNLCLCDIASTF